MTSALNALATFEKKGRDLLVYRGGGSNWVVKPSRSGQAFEARLIINDITRARGCGATKEAAMEAAAAAIVWTETENAVHALGRLPTHAPAPRAKPDHLALLCQQFQRSQLRWLPSLKVHRLKEKRASEEVDPWASSCIVVLLVSCEFGTVFHRGEASNEKAAAHEAARAALQWYAGAMESRRA
ncbi:hypothetical protein PENSPDRAFT_735960 [Peniophora sp. CONT]|nr:hypothetical protein PENSPDRAFT_735960 [Peniophora sp. CONT]